jgi:hypothetical protein
MKTYQILSCISFAALCTISHGATASLETEKVVLPDFVVSAPRLQPAEKSIESSLAEFRQHARVEFSVSPGLPLPKADDSRSLRVAVVDRAPAQIQTRKS